ncbi:hypothetical protein CPLU01_02548 [Colletotrichum plurivorum]|uniref:Uncharacterized protein n=1 Tax=Colletotrichum plurivorum TaxID=2175906 RepID=A0A8H6NLM0_9PEZI|nr:hypothetical protein CPLU01_02548 [Colletotrichum plurivorum]
MQTMNYPITPLGTPVDPTSKSGVRRPAKSNLIHHVSYGYRLTCIPATVSIHERLAHQPRLASRAAAHGTSLLDPAAYRPLCFDTPPDGRAERVGSDVITKTNHSRRGVLLGIASDSMPPSLPNSMLSQADACLQAVAQVQGARTLSLDNGSNLMRKTKEKEVSDTMDARIVS